MAERKASKPKTSRWQRLAMMDKEILDVEGAATLLGVSTTTIYNLARKGKIPATRAVPTCVNYTQASESRRGQLRCAEL